MQVGLSISIILLPRSKYCLESPNKIRTTTITLSIWVPINSMIKQDTQ
jgi:hypothetical protein